MPVGFVPLATVQGGGGEPMKASRINKILAGAALGVVAAASVSIGLPVHAQGTGDDGYARRDERSRVGQGAAEDGPVRLARFSHVHGNVTWRANDSSE